jgi:16S rRNA (cytidine1402-2'-O)-methyltransferase
MVRECVRNGIEVQCLPGATAFVPALVSSGLPDERFCFEGFLLQKKGRVTRLTQLQEEHRTMIFYESPYRLVKTLTQFIEFFGPDRPVSVCREISKVHEESVRGTLTEVAQHFTETEPKGEIVIVLGGKPEVEGEEPEVNTSVEKPKRRKERKEGAFVSKYAAKQAAQEAEADDEDE